MVKRLVDQAGLHGTDRQLAELFRAAAPREADPFRKRRILVRLERESTRSPGVARLWLHPLVLAALLVSGTATAALGHRYVFHSPVFLGLDGELSATVAGVTVAPRSVPRVKHAPKGN